MPKLDPGLSSKVAKEWFEAVLVSEAFYFSTVLRVSSKGQISISVAFSTTFKAQPSNTLRFLVPQGSRQITAS